MSKMAKKKKPSPGGYKGSTVQVESTRRPTKTNAYRAMSRKVGDFLEISSRQRSLGLASVSFSQAVEVVQLHDNDSKLSYFPSSPKLERRRTVGVRAKARSDTSALAKTHCRPDSSASPASSPWLWVNALGCLPNASLHFSFPRRRRRPTLFSDVTLENMRKSKQRRGHKIFGAPFLWKSQFSHVGCLSAGREKKIFPI